MGPRRSTRRQPAPALSEYEEQSYTAPPAVKSKKNKAPTNKERFDFLEQQLAQVTEAIGRLSTQHSDHDPPPPALSSPHSIPDTHVSAPPHLSRASTPKHKVSVRRALLNKVPEPPCTASLLADPLVTNASLLNDVNTQRHVEHVARATAARMPRSSGKPTYDVYINKLVGYEMPRHFVGLHSQRRIKSLDSYDDLSLPEFLQGFVAMIMREGLDIPTTEAMTRCLGLIGEALVDYKWEVLRDWINSVLHDVGQGRITWLDERAINDRLNTAKMRASMRPGVDADIPVCGPYNQGKCPLETTHGQYRHICVSCWLMVGAQHAHPLLTCRRRSASQYQGPANARQGQGDHYNRQGNQQHNGNRAYYSNNHSRDRQRSQEGRTYSNDNPPLSQKTECASPGPSTLR